MSAACSGAAHLFEVVREQPIQLSCVRGVQTLASSATTGSQVQDFKCDHWQSSQCDGSWNKKLIFPRAKGQVSGLTMPSPSTSKPVLSSKRFRNCFAPDCSVSTKSNTSLRAARAHQCRCGMPFALGLGCAPGQLGYHEGGRRPRCRCCRDATRPAPGQPASAPPPTLRSSRRRAALAHHRTAPSDSLPTSGFKAFSSRLILLLARRGYG